MSGYIHENCKGGEKGRLAKRLSPLLGNFCEKNSKLKSRINVTMKKLKAYKENNVLSETQ
jgi:hypothetical protein